MPTSNNAQPTESAPVTTGQWTFAAIIGLSLALGVWRGLVMGGGLVGGDTYPYILPQKVVLGDAFAAGEIPLWHNLTGLGYPMHAESQAGVFYPTNQILYRVLDVHSAYNASIVLHYWLAFLFTWRFARSEHVGMCGALLAALVFVYGWFPARVSLEWTIVGGVWFPLTLWLCRRLLDRPDRVRFAVLAACLGTHLLAGHFTLAFINQLTIVCYAGLRTWFDRRKLKPRIRCLNVLLPVAAIVAGLGLACVQLIPTYELKKASQREGVHEAFSPACGHMPPLYATQVVASWWYWHSADVRAAQRILDTPGAIDADTNAVEAHLYWGILPLALMTGLLRQGIRAAVDRTTVVIWAVLSAGGLIYATGWLLPVTAKLPGFGFFIGPGRYTMITALGGALLAGTVLNALLSRRSSVFAAVITILISGVTLQDLLWSSEHISDAVVVAAPPFDKVENSWIRKALAEHPETVRLLAPGPNVGNLFGVSCVPQYLGLGPSIYFDDALRPATSPTNDQTFPGTTQLQQLEALGITHILTTERIPTPADAIELIGGFPDAFLNAVWGRGLQPCYLYRLLSSPERIVADPPQSLQQIESATMSRSETEFTITLSEPADVTLRDLNFPGWKVTVDQQPAIATASPLSLRTVQLDAGQHIVNWSYEPTSFRVGWGLSVLFGTLLLLLIVWPKRRPHVQTASSNTHHEPA